MTSVLVKCPKDIHFKRTAVLDNGKPTVKWGRKVRGLFRIHEIDSPATEGANMTTLIELDKIPFSIYKDCKILRPDMVCANPNCESDAMEFSVIRINGMLLSRFGNYCCRGCLCVKHP